MKYNYITNHSPEGLTISAAIKQEIKFTDPNFEMKSCSAVFDWKSQLPFLTLRSRSLVCSGFAFSSGLSTKKSVQLSYFFVRHEANSEYLDESGYRDR